MRSCNICALENSTDMLSGMKGLGQATHFGHPERADGGGLLAAINESTPGATGLKLAVRYAHGLAAYHHQRACFRLHHVLRASALRSSQRKRSYAVGSHGELQARIAKKKRARAKAYQRVESRLLPPSGLFSILVLRC